VFTALIEIVMLDGGIVVVAVEEVENCVINAVVLLHIVDTIVVVALRTPPKGEKCRTVERGVLYPYGPPTPAASGPAEPKY
jgi:hypothetical protein